MTFVESLGTYLASYAGLSALVGTNVFPVRAPDNPPRPYVVYRVRLEPENTLTNEALTKALITVTTHAINTSAQSGYFAAHAIAEQVRAALSFFRGTLATNGVVSEGSLVMSTDDSEAPEFGMFETITEAEMWV